MTVLAIECKRCGAALPAPGGGSPFVTCSYCGMSHAVSAEALVLAPQAQGTSDYELRQAAANRAWDAARASSTDPVVALRAMVAAVAHGLKTEQDLERAARLAEALGAGFDQENGTHTIADKPAALRLAEAAVKAVIQLHPCPDTTVNLPFLAVGPSGPVHLSHEVTRATLAQLDAMGVYVVNEAAPPPRPAPAQEVAARAPRPKRWWPFG